MTGMHNTKRESNPKLPLGLDESGATAIFFVLMLSLLCGFTALAFDIGHIFMVRAELQRTADAAALAGVTGLLPYTGSAPTQTPAWASGLAKAHAMISNGSNQADNLQFTSSDGSVDYGYWLVAPPSGYVQTLPKARPTTAAYLPEPAIRVTLSRDVTLFFAPVVGVPNPKTVRATATAILPEGYSTTGFPPLAVSYDTVYNPDPTHPGTYIIDVAEQDIKPQSNKGVAGWININGGNSVPSVRIDAQMVADPTGVATGSKVYSVPGTKASLMTYINAGDTVILPVIDEVSKMDWSPIKEWAAFKVDSLDANSMTGHFVTPWYDPNVKPAPYTDATIGVISGTPKLVGP
jgi:Flp pilus assembly protein TadG